jgi:predicted RNA-binding protein with PUA-like domain
MLCLLPFELVSLIGDNVIYTDNRWNKLKKETLMAYFLAKTDPKSYSIDDLEHDKRTVWDGVRSAAALLAIRAMHTNDDVLIYHSQSEAAIVGLARVVSEPRPDPNDSKSWVVDMEFVRRFFQPITLHEIKESHLFDDWALVRQGRLSTMSVPENVVTWLKEKKVL